MNTTNIWRAATLLAAFGIVFAIVMIATEKRPPSLTESLGQALAAPAASAPSR